MSIQTAGARTLRAVCFTTALVTLLLVSCDNPPTKRGTRISTEPGLPRYQQAGAVAVPGGILNTAGGNLMVPRTDLSIDTRLGTREVGAVYNARGRNWTWSFEVSYAEGTFVDATGAEHAAGFLPDGNLIPGTSWVRVDAWRIRSVGGLMHHFDSMGHGGLTAIHWVSQPYPRLAYRYQPFQGEPRVVEVEQCLAPGDCATVYSVARDFFGNVTQIVDRGGRRAEFTWAGGDLVTARDAHDVEVGAAGFRYEYAPGSRLRAVTNSEGERVEYECVFGLRRLMKVTEKGPVDRVHAFAYGEERLDVHKDEPVRWTRYTDPLGNVTRFWYDGWHRPRRVVSPSGDETTREWQSFQPKRLERPGGEVTEWEYVDANTVVRREPSGNEVTIDFCVGSCEYRAQPHRRPIERVEDGLGVVEARGYADQRLVWIENGEGERTSYSYGADNLLSAITHPDGTVVSLSDPGEHGHPETVEVAGETETRTYDAAGNLVARTGLDVVDFRPGGEVARHYDGDRNVSRIDGADTPIAGAPVVSSLHLEYRSDRRPTRIARPYGGDHEFDYGAYGQLAARRERVDGTWRATLFETDALGRRTAETFPNGMRRERDYDADGRPIARRTYRNGVLEREVSISYADGHLATLSDTATGSDEVYTWDDAGRLSSITFPGGELLLLDHDPRGRRTRERFLEMTGAPLATLEFGWDAVDRRTSWVHDGIEVLRHEFAAARLDRVTAGNGLVEQRSYDAVTGMPTASTLTHPTQGIVALTQIGIAALATPAAVEVAVDTTIAGPLAATRHETYELGPGAGESAGEGKRLRAWDDGAAGSALAFDALGNLAQSGTTLHVYNAERNRLLRIEEASGATVVDYSYDAAGFATTRGATPLAWTAAGQLAAVGDDVFEWDALGRPLRRVVAGVERRFAFGGRVETDAAGAWLRLDLGDVVLDLDAGTRRYRHRDFRGNTKLVSDDTGEIVAHYAYDGHGPTQRAGVSEDADTFAAGRWVGDLVLLGARAHDPVAGRFLSPDPLLQTASQFAYANGNPIWWWDPTGLHSDHTATVARLQAQIRIGWRKIGTGALVVVVSGTAPVPLPVKLFGAGVGFTLISTGWDQAATANAELEAARRAEPGGSGSPGPTPKGPDEPGRGSGSEPGSVPLADPANQTQASTPTSDAYPAAGSLRTNFFPNGHWSGFGF